jgi:Trk-type K+ transport system membrane component
MKQALLRTILRKEVLGVARSIAIFTTVLLVLFEFGVHPGQGAAQLLDGLAYGLVCLTAVVTLLTIVRAVLRGDRVRRAELWWLAGAISLIALRPAGIQPWPTDATWPHLIFLLVFTAIELSRLDLGRGTARFNPALLFAASFVLLIVLGSLLLRMPDATTRPLPYVDALFTATSAVCVTGLSTIDIPRDLTRTGQMLMLVLSQIGGLGMMTFTSFFAFLFKGRSSLEEQLRIRDIAQTTLGSARGFIMRVVFFTLTVEAIGAVLIHARIGGLGLAPEERLFQAVFHAVAAFMNTGFSTLPDDVLRQAIGFNYPLLWVMTVLIVAGGLGFGIIFNFSLYLRAWAVAAVRRLFTGAPRGRFPRVVTISTRLVLVTTAILMGTGVLAFLVLERDHTLLAHESAWGRFTYSVFATAAVRTAGFNVVDFSAVQFPVVMTALLLMYVGGSPGSVAGGIKTTTFAVATLNVFASARGRRRVELFGRELSNHSIRRAFATIVLSLVFLGLSIGVVAALEPELPLLAVAFECFSAFSTVGQSMGITAELGTGTRYVMVAVMYIGRVSALTLLVSVLRQVTVTSYRYPKEDIQIN